MITPAGSSQLHTAALENYVEREGRLSPREDGPKGDDQRSITNEDTDSSDLSSIAESEGDSDDALNDDEETGLTAKQKNDRRRRRKKQRKRLDARIAGVKAKTSNVVADKNVVMRLTINAALIGMWYLFSLAISIVSPCVVEATE